MSDIVLSEIKQTKRGRYALFCGGEFLFSVDEQTMSDRCLVSGMSLSEQELADIQKAGDNSRAFRKALDYLALRDHSSAELKTKLMRTFDEHTAQYAVDKAREIGYMDDGAFARRYADELRRKGASLRGIRGKLWQKGIDRETAEEILAAADTDETSQIRALIEKKYRVKLAAGGTRAVFAALARRGFSPRDIRAVLSECGGDIDEEC